MGRPLCVVIAAAALTTSCSSGKGGGAATTSTTATTAVPLTTATSATVGVDQIPDPSSPIPPTSTGTMKAVPFENGGVFPFYCDFHGAALGMFGAVLVNP